MISMFNIHFAVLLLYFLISTHASIVRIQNDPNLRYTPGELTIAVDPPDGFESPTGLGVFVQASTPTAIIFYTISWAVLGFTDIPEAYPEYDEFYQFDTIDKENAIVINTTTYVAFNNTPYVHIDTPYNKARNVRLRVIAVDVDIDGDYFRSDEYFFNYIVEGSDRPLSYGFLVPGPETSGNFVSFSIEMKATARAQSAGGQEYSDFFSDLGIGTYPSQVVPLKLTDIVPGLTGFEGGFAVNMTNGKHYGVLVPYHNGVDFHGRVVRVDLQRLRRDEDGGDAAACAQSVRIEAIDKNGTLRTFGETTENACVTILDLGTKHPLAKGFRKGFVGYPYGYLAAGTYNVVVRLDMENFTLANAVTFDLSVISPSLGGFSGGFADGSWACFCPFKHFSGSYGGIRSSVTVDRNTLRVFYSSVILCINSTMWDGTGTVDTSVMSLDVGDLDPGLRGYAEAVRVGRYAYLAPLASYTHTYTSRVIRINLGPVDIATKLKSLLAEGKRARNMLNVLDLTQKDPELSGFSSLYSSGKYLFLVPYRNEHTPQTGQRGHGKLVRIDMNNFAISGIDVVNMPITARTQIPSFADIDLRCFTGGFASGQYGILVPFYNGVFSGKSARVTLYDKNFGDNLQELDFARDRLQNNTYIGFRGGFVSLWQGNPNIPL